MIVPVALTVPAVATLPPVIVPVALTVPAVARLPPVTVPVALTIPVTAIPVELVVAITELATVDTIEPLAVAISTLEVPLNILVEL